MRPSWPVALCGMAWSCATHVAPGPETLPPAEIYDISLRVDVDTALQPPAPELQDTLPASFGFDLELVVAVMDARRFRDDSLGRLVWIDQATLDGAPWGLAGRSVELRSFVDGEILAIGDGAHLAGLDRQGDSLEILFGLLSPHIPTLQEGGRAPSANTFVVQVDPWRGLRERTELDWTHAGMVEDGWRLTYTGDWRGRGKGGPEGDEAGALVFDGQVAGELRVARADRALLAHQASWTRELSVTSPDAPAGPVTLTQRQRFAAELRRRPGPDAAIEARMRLPAEARIALAQASIDAPVDADGRSLGRYLRDDEVQRAIDALVPALSGCVPAGVESARFTATVQIAGDGGLRGALAPDPLGSSAACVRDALLSVRLPIHDEASVRVELDLDRVGGALVQQGTARILAREVPLAFVLVPPNTTADAARALAARMQSTVSGQGSSVQGSDPTGD